jgi:hypothetical protein
MNFKKNEGGCPSRNRGPNLLWRHKGGQVGEISNSVKNVEFGINRRRIIYWTKNVITRFPENVNFSMYDVTKEKKLQKK